MNGSEASSTDASLTCLSLYGVGVNHPSGVLSDELRNVLEPCLIYSRLVLAFVGVATNVINIRVFVEQGVRHDSTTACFLCLSVWDLLTCAALIPFDCCFLVRHVIDNMAAHLTCIAFTTTGVQVYIAFQNISKWTTVYISVMRSFCVLFPLKVKSMFAQKTTVSVMTCIVVFFSSIQIVYNAFVTIVWKHSPVFNTSIAYFTESTTARTILYYRLIIIYEVLPVIAIVVVSVNTVLMGRKLLHVKKWRQTNSNATSESHRTPSTELEIDDGNKPNATKNKQHQHQDRQKQLGSKEIQLIKFVNTVTTIFLICSVLGFAPSVAVQGFPGVSFNGVNRNLFYVTFAIRPLLDVINASINLFFYIRVSSRYRAAFHACVASCLGRGGKHK